MKAGLNTFHCMSRTYDVAEPPKMPSTSPAL